MNAELLGMFEPKCIKMHWFVGIIMLLFFSRSHICLFMNITNEQLKTDMLVFLLNKINWLVVWSMFFFSIYWE